MKNKLYNVLFPIWFLIIFPTMWLFVLPANFLIDTVVLCICLKALKITNINEVYKKSILKVWIFGFIADIIGSALLVCTQFISVNSFLSDIITALAYNPFSNIYAFLITIFAIVISGILIYVFNFKISFKKVDIDEKSKKRIAICLAVFTAPYLFLYPSSLLYKDKTDDLNNIQDNLKKIESEFSGDTITTRIFAESENYTNTNFMYIDKIAKVDSEVVEANTGSIVNMDISTEFDEDTDISEYKKWAKQCSIIVFIKQPAINEVIVNLQNDNKNEICKLTYFKNDIESEYGIKLEELENSSDKLQNILDSIK